MASAKIETVVVEPKKVIPEVVETTVTLTLSEEQALALSAVTGSIGGLSDLRRLTSEVYDALFQAGIRGIVENNRARTNFDVVISDKAKAKAVKYEPFGSRY